jgi:hypothetical protein
MVNKTVLTPIFVYFTVEGLATVAVAGFAPDPKSQLYPVFSERIVLPVFPVANSL